MKSTFIKELEGKGRRCTKKSQSLSLCYTMYNILSARTKAKKKILDEIDKMFKTCYKLINTKMSSKLNRTMLKKQNKLIEIEAKQIIEKGL